MRSDASGSEGEEGDEDTVPPIDVNDFHSVFSDLPRRRPVLENVRRAAVLMGTLCGDNQAAAAEMMDEEALELAREAYEFVTKYVVALFGPLN